MTIKKYVTDMNKIEKAKPRIGKPYAMQNRKQGEGKGKIGKKIDRNKIFENYANAVVKDIVRVEDYFNAGLTKKEMFEDVNQLDTSDYMEELFEKLKISEEEYDDASYIWGDKLDKKVKSILKNSLKDGISYMKQNKSLLSAPIEKSKPRIGKPYSQQAGRKAGEGKGKIGVKAKTIDSIETELDLDLHFFVPKEKQKEFLKLQNSGQYKFSYNMPNVNKGDDEKYDKKLAQGWKVFNKMDSQYLNKTFIVFYKKN